MQFNLLNVGMIGIIFGINVFFLFFNIVVMVLLLGFLSKIRDQYQRFHLEYGKKMDDANHEAAKIIDHTSKKAEKMINDVDIDTHEIKKRIEKNLNSSISTYSKSVIQSIDDINEDYNMFLKQVKESMKADTQKMVETVLNETRVEIDSFTSTMKEGTVQAQKQFETKLHEEFSKALANIDTYRNDQLSLIERSINRIIIKVTKDVLGEAVSVTDHEKLIFDSLERARKEEIFEGIIKQ